MTLSYGGAIEAAMSEAHAPSVPDVLNGDMTATEVVEVLTHLRFGRSNGTATVELDRHVARYLASLIRPRQRPAA